MSDTTITKEAGFTFANALFAFMTRSLTAAPPGFDVVITGTVVNRPTTIFDIQGLELFYDFPLENNQGGVGTVRVAASKLLGHPWVSIQEDKELDLSALEADAAAKVAAELPGSTLNDVKLVCFNYPRLGLLLTITNNSDAQVRRIYDLSSNPPVLTKLIEFEAGDNDVEGEKVYSVLGTLPEGGGDTQLTEFNQIDEVINSVFHEACEKRNLPTHVPKHTLSPGDQREALDWSTSNQPEGLVTKQKVLEIDNIQQENGTYCVLACIQMLLRHYDISTPTTQGDIRDILTQDPSLYVENWGVRPEKQVEAFSRCFGPGTEVTIDSSPTWGEAVIEIDNDRPFKSGIYGHARVCIGYHEVPVGPTTGGIYKLHRSFWMNDPSSMRKLELHETADLTSVEPLVISNVTPKIPLKTNHVVVKRD